MWLVSAAPPLAAQVQRAPLTFAPTRAILELVPGSEAQQALKTRHLAAVDAAGSAEAELLRECVNGEAQQGQVAKGFLFDIAARTWRVLLHPVAVSVHEELLKYASVSEARASGDYYRGGEAGGSSGALSGRISCLRFTRFASADPANEDVALDFIASVHLEPQHDALRLRPLRLYISQAAAKSAKGRYAVAIGMHASAVWRDEFSGHRGELFDETIVTENVDLKGGSFLKYYTAETSKGVRVPVIPTSFGVDRGRDYGRAEFAVRVAELGTPPATLTLLSEMLPDPDESFSKLVIAAAIASVGVH
ncbi:MAG TPA: hypothetical protein VEY89_08920 [Candidatus Dormibacteraeota bacterium]|nr:hypothetical protein [Candidatus Dormibacteraeota bacterium]